MKKFLGTLFLIIFSTQAFAQIDASAGMGISFLNNSSLKDYINANYAFDENELSTFYSAVDFYGEVDYTVNENFQLGIEYVYQLYSYNSSIPSIGQYDLTYNHHKPSLLAYYVIPGKGYKFRFGGGLGFRLVDITEDINQPDDFEAAGFGALLKAQGNTQLSEHFYALVGADLRYDIAGEPEGSETSNKLLEGVSFNSISFGVQLGISYFF
jgi:long-subunit fatty acid transport protein